MHPGILWNELCIFMGLIDPWLDAIFGQMQEEQMLHRYVCIILLNICLRSSVSLSRRLGTSASACLREYGIVLTSKAIHPVTLFPHFQKHLEPFRHDQTIGVLTTNEHLGMLTLEPTLFSKKSCWYSIHRKTYMWVLLLLFLPKI